MDQTGSRPNILIIDDVTSNLLVLAEIIREAGYTPRPVSNVRHADQAIAAALPTLILLDVTMPEVSGYEYCAKLKESVTTRDIPVIFISALNSAKDRVKGFECGAVDFISKPFERAEVLVRIGTHLKLYKYREEAKQHNRKLYSMVNQQFYKIARERKNIVFALAKLADAREDASGRHIANVSKNCRLLALGLQLTRKYEKKISPEFVETIELASQLHDIGKSAMPDRLLLKPGPLDDEEKKEMEKHTTIGADTLREIFADNENNEFLEMAIDIAENHHERWDGTGFPGKRAGEKIPLAARILAVADVYDALVSGRCYKSAYSHERAMELMNSLSGKVFDPDIISILNKLQAHLQRNDTDATDASDENCDIIVDPRR
ncbi:MAG: response regulator [Lachnospiraceae bacterium]|nr:response regulator [Lachnospiraceae bacterium]